MNIAELQTKLIAAARVPREGSERVPYLFEKRILALLPSRPVTDQWTLWARGLWHAAVSCAAIALLLGAWAVLNPAASSKSSDLSQNFESTLLASVDQSDQSQ
jgi:hypothetical protein